MSDHGYPVQNVRTSTTNGLGIAGFVVSLVGFLGCPLVALIGLILSAIAMRKEPRGFAIAGLVLGIIGTLFSLIVAAGILLPALNRAIHNAMFLKTQTEAGHVAQAVDRYKASNGSLPQSLSELVSAGLIADQSGLEDAWGNELRLVAKGSSYVIMSDGPDEMPNTEDDLQAYPTGR